MQNPHAFIKASNVLGNIFKCQIFYENVYLYPHVPSAQARVTRGARHWTGVWKTCCRGNDCLLHGKACCGAWALPPREGTAARRETAHRCPAEASRERTRAVHGSTSLAQVARGAVARAEAPAEMQTCRKVAAISESAGDASSLAWQRQTGTPSSRDPRVRAALSVPRHPVSGAPV